MSDSCSPLAGSHDCEVAVLGGGYTGMSAAMRLARSGADVALLESRFCGWGSSSRNAGHLTPTIAGDPQLLATVYRRRAPQLIRFADHAVRFAEEEIERHGIDCDYEKTGNVSAALTPGQLRRSEAIVRVLGRAGGDVAFVKGSEWGLPASFLGGVLERTGGLLDPGKLARGYRDALLRSGAKVFEQTPVELIASSDRGITLRTTIGRLTAKQVLVAANAYARDLPFGPSRAVAPLWVTLAETGPLEPGRIAELGWTSRSGVYTQHMILENYRPTARDTIVFGTRLVRAPRGAVADRSPDPSVVDDITKGLHSRFPSLRDVSVEKAWGGWIAMTPSWLPVAGRAQPNVFFALGYNGHGLAQAPYLGSLVADHMSGSARHEDLDVIWRDRARFAPAPMFSAPALRLGWRIDRATDRFAARRGPATAPGRQVSR